MTPSFHVNLLDWRAKYRDRRKREFTTTMAGVVVLALLVAVVVTVTIKGQISTQRQRNAFLQQQIDQTDKQIAQIKDLKQLRSDLIERMQVIQTLQQNRSATVHFFTELVKTLPDGVYLTDVQQKGGVVTISGVAQSNARVSEYLSNLDNSPWLSAPQLVVIKTGGVAEEHRSTFTLRVSDAPPSKATNGDGDALAQAH